MKPAADRVATILSVKTPLAFFTLIVLIAEGVFALIAPTVDLLTRRVMIYSLIVLIFCLAAYVGYMAREEFKLAHARRARYVQSPGSIHVGDTVVLTGGTRETVIMEKGAVEWNDAMQVHLGSVTLVSTIDFPMQMCRVEADSQQFVWHFNWLVKVREQT